MPIVINRFSLMKWAHRWIVEKSMKRHGQFIDLLLQDVLDGSTLVELSLRIGKTYIGYVTEKNIDSVSDADVGLIPVLSGYRDNGTRRLVITTSYANVVLQCGKEGGEFTHLSREQLKVLVPRSEIISARHFDPAVAAHFDRFEEK